MFLNKKIEMCNEKDISVGFVVKSEAKNLEEIYNDVELAKSIIQKNKILWKIQKIMGLTPN